MKHRSTALSVKLLLILLFMTGCTGAPSDEDTKDTIIAFEKQALELWNNGNPDGFLDLSSDDVVYFDPSFESKLEGKKALEDYYNTVRGQIHIDKWRMIEPVVRVAAGAAVLTYNYEAERDGQTFRMNCTEVYISEPSDGWKIVHTHWSFAQPFKQARTSPQ